jgi:hypothetical protein
MFNTIVGTGAVGVGVASRYGSSSGQKMRLLAAPAPQHWLRQSLEEMTIKNELCPKERACARDDTYHVRHNSCNKQLLLVLNTNDLFKTQETNSVFDNLKPNTLI